MLKSKPRNGADASTVASPVLLLYKHMSNITSHIDTPAVHALCQKFGYYFEKVSLLHRLQIAQALLQCGCSGIQKEVFRLALSDLADNCVPESPGLDSALVECLDKIDEEFEIAGQHITLAYALLNSFFTHSSPAPADNHE